MAMSIALLVAISGSVLADEELQGLPAPIELESLLEVEAERDALRWLSRENDIIWLLTWAATLFLGVIGLNMITRTVVRYTEVRGIIRVTPTSAEKQQVNVLGRDLVMPQKFPNVLLSDLVMSVQYFTIKLSHWTWAIVQMFLLNESRSFNKTVAHEQSTETKKAIQEGTVMATRTVYLIRHGESVWNLIFNQSSIFVMPFRLLLSIICEIFLFCEPDSLFLDTPLSSAGLKQCQSLSSWVDNHGSGDHSMGSASERQTAAAILRGERPATFIVSNLRRAISTLLLGWGSAMRAGGKNSPSRGKVFVTSTLQEATRNVDSYSLAAKQGIQEASVMEKAFLQQHVARLYSTCLVTAHNHGSKATASTLVSRQKEMMDFIFALGSGSFTAQPAKGDAIRRNTDSSTLEDPSSCNPLVVCGHSLYFRNLFRRYLRSDHVGKKSKIQNAGVVKIQVNMVKGSNGVHYYDIVPDSITPLFKGFA